MKKIINVDCARRDPAQNICDRCVLCGRETNVPSDLPIVLRSNYVEAVGQLCPACWREVYGENQNLAARYTAAAPPGKQDRLFRAWRCAAARRIYAWLRKRAAF